MNRIKFLKNILGFGLLSTLGCGHDPKKPKLSPLNTKATTALRKELVTAWHSSEKMTMINVEQMPQDYFNFKYTDESMTFSEQWRHCIVYTCGQLAARIGINNPYENIGLPVQMPKADVIKELKKMYTFVRQSIKELPEEKLHSMCDFAGETIQVWRLFYAMENHIIHHRGQCVVYLRLNGVVPKGFYGW